MRLFVQLSGHGHRISLILAAGALALGLAACAGDMDDVDASGSAFTQALFKDYSDLANQAAALPADAAPEDSSFWDGLNPFGSSSASSNELLAESFTAKAKLAAAGSEPDPEAAPGPAAGGIRARLMRALAAGKDKFPDQAARAQTDYDCWVLYGAVPSAAAAAQACKTALNSSLPRLEAAGRPAPPPVPVASAPVAPPPTTENTVYFDFNSWRLSAEDLSVITNVINTARAGGQTNITVVGHTDTSGDAAYNQKLSAHRANVVSEALVDMGARRAAIHASGVGEADLAVQTPDGVKEAKNRRAVITLQP